MIMRLMFNDIVHRMEIGQLFSVYVPIDMNTSMSYNIPLVDCESYDPNGDSGRIGMPDKIEWLKRMNLSVICVKTSMNTNGKCVLEFYCAAKTIVGYPAQ